jgi:acyl-CoA hydrolase
VIEQRKHQRFDLRLPFEIVLGDRSRSQGETKNVSSSGVLFTAPVGFELGESIEYYITLPKVVGSKMEVRVRCVGKVVRNEPESAFAATLERYEFVRKRV